MTIFEAYNDTKKQLESFEIEDFVFEAKQIIKHITGYDNKDIMMKYAEKLSEFQKNHLTMIIKMRKTRYPLQYILGEWSFYGLNFRVGVGVLCPRADTEVLVDTALEFLKNRDNSSALELCSGSGCIAVAIGKNSKNSNITAVEKYDEAYGYLVKNIELNSCNNIKPVMGDVFKGDYSDEKYDIIVSNPPYISSEEMEIISPEALFEPEQALLAADEGLEFYRGIVCNYKNSLNKGGMIAFEVGFKQAKDVCGILNSNGFTDVGTKTDINNVQRVVFGTLL